VYTDTDTLGVELEGTSYLGKLFDIGFSAMWQDPEFGRLTSSQVVDGEVVVSDFSGNRLVRVPEISYRITPALNLLNDAIRVELDYQYFGKRYADAANSVELPDYDVVNANLRVALTDRITLYARGENLLDEVGLTEGNPRAGQFQSGEANSPFFVARPIFGRNFRFSLLWEF
jgi:outer membrane receptor protein involved in Fe transport